MSQQDKEKEYYDKGKKALIDNDYDVAINEFTKAIEMYPTHADTFNNRGVVYEKKGEHNKAISDYTSAIKVFPKDKDKIFLATIYNNRGSVYFKKRNYNLAINEFTKAIEINPDFTDAYLNRGNAYFNKKDNAKAIEDYTKAIKLDPSYKTKITPNLAEVYKRRGLSSLENDNYDDAINDFSKAIDLQPNDSEAYSRRGITYAKKSDNSNAINDINKAIIINPKNAKAYYARGRIYDMSDNIDKAINDYSKVIEIDQYSVSAYSNRGLLYSEIGEYDRALDDYNTVIEFKQEDSNAYNARGHIYRLKKEYDKAIDDFNKAIELDINNAYAYNNLGGTYNDQGYISNNEKDFDNAIINFTKAIELKSGYAVAFNNLGSAYAYKYIIYVNKVRQCHKNNIPFSEYEKIAIINYDKAITNFTKAIKLKPDYVNAYNNRGNIYKIKGEGKKAQDDFTKAKSLTPNRIDSTTAKDENNILIDFVSTIKVLKDAHEISDQLLYKYKAVNRNILSALEKDSIWVASPKTFNDPLDGSYLYDKIQDPRFKKELEGIGILSFEGNKAEKGGINTLMWSHYADSHKGVCLIYKRVDCQDNEQVNCKNNRILKVKYEDDISLRLDTTEDMFETGFRTKHSSWKYENEYRLLLHQGGLGNGLLFTTKELGLALIGIIFGLKCNNEDLIKKILDKQNIEYYKIEQKVKHRVIKHLQLIKKRVDKLRYGKGE